MNRHDLHELQAVHGYPCLTITLPTHRTRPDNKQDPIRVKNLVSQATNRLLDEFSKRDVAPLLERLDALVADIDYKYALDGLVLTVSRDMAREYVLPFPLEERVVVDNTFFIRDLVHALNRMRRYWVLSLSEQSTRLYSATREHLEGIFKSTTRLRQALWTMPSTKSSRLCSPKVDASYSLRMVNWRSIAASRSCSGTDR